MIGKTLAHYEITSLLGKGGMGEVYQAKDQKLGRDVAIKILPTEFARDADRLARFQREAKLLASLNHPNIAAIYGLEESDGTNFLVMELIDGDTLADRVKTGPIPVEEVLKLALQIAEALEAAHEKGVIHRDLKPANIKVTSDGKIKVLDFGLAKAFAEDQGEEKPQDSPTLSAAATGQGFILGTAAYMSPEQARGKIVDKRADIWAFGVVLYEMLTGKNLFEGEDVTSTLARVLERQPDFSALPTELHPRIRLLLERCLEKDPRDRYHDIADVRVDIQKVLADPNGVFIQPITAVKSRKRLGLPWIAAVFILGLIIAGVSVWNLKPAEPRRVVRFEYELPEGQQFTDLSGNVLAVSPDGNQFAYCTPEGIYLRSVDKSDVKLIAGTGPNPRVPFFSPDGKWIGYINVNDTKLKKIEVGGGAPLVLCDVPTSGLSANWGHDGTIVYSVFGGDGMSIMRVPAAGGTPELIARIGSGLAVGPQILPDGKSLLFTQIQPTPRVMVQSLGSGKATELFTGDNARYLPTGHIVYTVGNNLYAVPFDPDKLKVTGGAIPLVEGILRPAGRGTRYAVSDTGTLVYLSEKADPRVSGRTLVWVDREGREQTIEAKPAGYEFPRISPDGTRLALSILDSGKRDVWIRDLVHGTRTRLTFDGASQSPLWTPDGRRIVFVSLPEGKPGLCGKAADGTGEVQRLGPASMLTYPSSWSADAKFMILEKYGNIEMMSMEGDHTRKQLLGEQYTEANPQISPNGRFMAYMSGESGTKEVFVRPFPDVEKGKWQVSSDGGEEPRWSPNGDELYYRNGDAMMAVAVDTEKSFRFETPRELFRGNYYSVVSHQWDISPDGKRFLMIKESGGSSGGVGGMPRKIHVVLNWFEELKKRVPVK